MPSRRTLVVLGKNWRRRPFGPSIETEMVALAAGMLLRGDVYAYAILSGGHTAGGARPSEARALLCTMTRYMPCLSRRERDIILEERSIDTASNAEEVARILPGLGVRQVDLLSVCSHLPAARRLFETCGVSVGRAIPAEDVIRDRSRHHRAFVRRYRRSPRALGWAGFELLRRTLLRVDPQLATLRLLTHVLRDPQR